MQGNFKAKEALALLTTTKLADDNRAGAVKRWSKIIGEQLEDIAHAERSIPRQAIAVGLVLHSVKASLPHGEWTPWLTQTLTMLKSWTKGTAQTNASYYMRLALAFVDQAQPSRAELLALANEVVFADLDKGNGPVAKLVKRIDAFVNERSLQELLVDEGIKKSQGSLQQATKTAALPGDDDTLAQDAGQLLLNFDAVLLVPDNLKRFSPQQLEEMEQQLTSRLEQFRQLKAKLLNPNA